MKIEIGKSYENQTWNYLFPCLLDHGEVFRAKINSVFKLAVGIHDTLLDGTDVVQGNNIYILIDAKYQEGYYKAFIDWIRTQSYFVNDYWFDANLAAARKHMVIISIPKKHDKAYEHFLKSEYSKMYNKEDRLRLFYQRGKQQLYDILEQNSIAKSAHIERINKEFGTKMLHSELEGGEYDFPLIKEENVFNCLKGDRTYFNEELDKVWSS